MGKNANRIITLNCGLGRDSLTMLCLAFEGRLEADGLGTVSASDLDAVIFSDTGCEWEHTYSLIPRVRELCEAHGVEFVVLAKGDGRYHYRPAIMADFESRATVASLGKGDCTDNHKIQPIRRWINERSLARFGVNNRSYSAAVRKGARRPHVTLIGIAADETSRLANGGHGPAYVEERYPLVTMGIAKPDETPILERWGFNHVRKSGCFMCPYQPASWYWALSVAHPGTWERAVEYERIALERNSRMAATGYKRRDGSPMPLPEVVSSWRAANPDATVAAVLDKQYSRCTKQARAAQRSELVTLKLSRSATQMELF
jgi:3'-phosphoadenosine 5'-phosphosulfate sulfotransferase (PAPS reductase)/FAD synthetase